MKKLVVLTSLAVLAAMASAQAPKATLSVGDQAPALVIAKWAKGTPVEKLGNGKINVVEFWATWCGPCKVSIPHITELAKKYAGKVEFIGVDSFERLPDDDTCFSKVGKFVDDFGDKMDYHVAIDGHDGTMAKTWMDAAGQNGIPTAFVVGKDGKIAWIGHPMSLDTVIDKVVDGTFDIQAEAAKQKEAQAAQQAAQQKQAAMIAPLRKALAAKDYKAAVEAADKIIADNPNMKLSLSVSKIVWMSYYDPKAATKLTQSLADNEFKADSQMLNTLAWQMVEDKSPVQHPDYKVAVKIAEKAVKLSKDDPMVMDTLALAYFRAKRTADAIAVENKAIDKASQDSKFDAATLTEMKGRLSWMNGGASAQKTK